MVLIKIIAVMVMLVCIGCTDSGSSVSRPVAEVDAGQVAKDLSKALSEAGCSIEQLEGGVRLTCATAYGDILHGRDGARGEKGDRGDQGLQGIQGAAGAAGAQGLQGAAGAQGAVGTQGAQGLRGDQGAKGDPGEPGAKGDKGDPGEPGQMPKSSFYVSGGQLRPYQTLGRGPALTEIDGGYYTHVYDHQRDIELYFVDDGSTTRMRKNELFYLTSNCAGTAYFRLPRRLIVTRKLVLRGHGPDGGDRWYQVAVGNARSPGEIASKGGYDVNGNFTCQVFNGVTYASDASISNTQRLFPVSVFSGDAPADDALPSVFQPVSGN